VLLTEHPSIVNIGESIYLHDSLITPIENLCLEAFEIKPKQLKLTFFVQWYKVMDIVELTENYQAKYPPKTEFSLNYLLYKSLAKKSSFNFIKPFQNGKSEDFTFT
jgi:hypothetical protein